MYIFGDIQAFKRISPFPCSSPLPLCLIIETDQFVDEHFNILLVIVGSLLGQIGYTFIGINIINLLYQANKSQVNVIYY